MFQEDENRSCKISKTYFRGHMTLPLLHSIGQNKSQGQGEFKEVRNELHLFFFFNFIYLFYFWLCWVFVSVRGLPLVAASGGHSSSRCVGLSVSRPLLLRSTDSRRAGSVVVAHGPSHSAACGIFPDQGSNPCPLHWQADSQPLHHQVSPELHLLIGGIAKSHCKRMEI